MEESEIAHNISENNGSDISKDYHSMMIELNKYIKEANKSYNKAKKKIEELVILVEEVRNSTNGAIKVVEEKSEIFEEINALFNKKTNDLDERMSYISAWSQKYEEKDDIISDILVDIKKDAFESKKNKDEIDKIIEKIKSENENVDDDITEIFQSSAKIEKLSKRLFDDETDEDDVLVHKSFVTKINELESSAQKKIDDVNKLNMKWREEIETLKIELQHEIRELLPSAAAAGLASTYGNAKSHYNRTKNIIFLYFLFLAPLCWGAYKFYESGNNLDDLLVHFLYASPLAAIATFGLLSIRMYRRLYEEYGHKQSVMELYHGFKKEIDQLDAPDMQKRLVSIMLETVGHKPSLIMSRYERTEESKKLPSWQVIAKMRSLAKIEKDTHDNTPTIDL